MIFSLNYFSLDLLVAELALRSVSRRGSMIPGAFPGGQSPRRPSVSTGGSRSRRPSRLFGNCLAPLDQPEMRRSSLCLSRATPMPERKLLRRGMSSNVFEKETCQKSQMISELSCQTFKTMFSEDSIV